MEWKDDAVTASISKNGILKGNGEDVSTPGYVSRFGVMTFAIIF